MATIGAPIEFPPVVYSHSDSLSTTLTLAEADYVGPGVTQRTRLYNGGIGPTIRVKPGDILSITLNNNLPSTGLDTSAIHNQCRDIDVTNLHPHGLHVSSEEPADDVFIKVGPGESYTYTYKIPEDHMAGTFWYHPHHHGSTTMQAGGGAAGAIIIEDPPGSLPPSVESLEEMLLFLTHFDMPTLHDWAAQCVNTCQQPPPMGINGTAEECARMEPLFSPDQPTAGYRTNSILVNGMTQPKINMVANRWYRWRMVYAAQQGAVTPALPDACEVGLLAKDGIYIPEAPRKIDAAYLGAGNRADVVVRCSAGTHSFISNGLLGAGAQSGRGATGAITQDTHAQLLATIVATEQGEPLCDLGLFSVSRPCYLVDLTGQHGGATPAETKESFNVSFPGMTISNIPFHNSTHPILTTFKAGTVNYYNLHRIDAHPFHTHVNPFQLASEPEDSVGGYFQVGDWHDTYFAPTFKSPKTGFMKVLQNVDFFTGKMVLHCHILQHEELGMMGVVNIDGQEGSRFDTRHLLPDGDTCFMSAFDRTANAPKIHRPALCLPRPTDSGETWSTTSIVMTVVGSFFLLIGLGALIAALILGHSPHAAPSKQDCGAPPACTMSCGDRV